MTYLFLFFGNFDTLFFVDDETRDAFVNIRKSSLPLASLRTYERIRKCIFFKVHFLPLYPSDGLRLAKTRKISASAALVIHLQTLSDVHII